MIAPVKHSRGLVGSHLVAVDVPDGENKAHGMDERKPLSTKSQRPSRVSLAILLSLKEFDPLALLIYQCYPLVQKQSEFSKSKRF